MAILSALQERVNEGIEKQGITTDRYVRNESIFARIIAALLNPAICPNVASLRELCCSFKG